MNTTYLKYELLRTLRNRMGFVFSLAFPVVMFLVIALSQEQTAFTRRSGGIPPATYYMIGLLGFGGIGAVLSGGGRISVDRALGWNRQLLLTPLKPWVYLASKVMTGYLVAGMTLIVMYAAGIAAGARAPVDRWIEMTALVLIGLIPFAAMGIWLGHVTNGDAVGPFMGGSMTLFGMMGGAWFPLVGWMRMVGQYLPSYWITSAGRVAVGGEGWPVKGWLVVGCWSAVLGVLAARAYQADTKRR
jgi:ABC-2 type transport system permease protein